MNFLNPFRNLEQKMAKRMGYLEHRNMLERNFIAKRTINIAPRISHTVTPKEWVSDPNHMQLNQWFNYVTSIREK